MEEAPPNEWPRDPDYTHYYEHHDRKRREREHLGITAKTPLLSLGSGGRFVGFGGDVVVPIPTVEKFNAGLGYIYYPFKEIGETGHRFSLFLDFSRLSCYARFRLGLYSEMPEFERLGEEYESIEGGIMSEVVLTLYRKGHLRLGGSLMAGLGGSAKGIRVSAGGAPTLEVHF